MSLTSIRIESAAEGRDTSDQARSILEVFTYRSLPNHYPFNVKDKPSVICVGYVGGAAVTAASSYESTMIDRTDDKATTPFTGLPYLGVSLIATDTAYQRQGHGKQLVEAILNLAASHEFDRVEASQPSNDDARLFWGACGFKSLPFTSFGDYDMYRGARDANLEDIGVETSVATEINDLLASFVQAQTTS